MFVNRVAITSGWGKTEVGSLSNILKEAKLKVLSNEDCTVMHQKVDWEVINNNKLIETTEYNKYVKAEICG